jgi:hypothetical protein
VTTGDSRPLVNVSSAGFRSERIRSCDAVALSFEAPVKMSSPTLATLARVLGAQAAQEYRRGLNFGSGGSASKSVSRTKSPAKVTS